MRSAELCDGRVRAWLRNASVARLAKTVVFSPATLTPVPTNRDDSSHSGSAEPLVSPVRLAYGFAIGLGEPSSRVSSLSLRAQRPCTDQHHLHGRKS
jgi:hypothetical protein